MPKGLDNIGVAEVLGEGYLHGSPVRGALDILVLLWCYDLHNGMPHPHLVKPGHEVQAEYVMEQPLLQRMALLTIDLRHSKARA